MKKLIVLFAIYICHTTIYAQFTITLNGKKVTANQEFNYADIKNLTVSFSNPQKLPTYSEGYVTLSCSFFDESGVKKNAKYVSKKIEGAASINSFLNQKIPKTFSLYPKSEEPEFFHYLYDYSGNPKEQFSDICEGYKSSPYGGKVRLKFEIEYHELTGWHYGSDNFTKFNDYGEAVELIEPFEMVLKIADKNALIDISTLNTKFSLSDFTKLNFEKIDSLSRWDDIGNITGTGNTKPKKTTFKFKGNFFVYSLKLTYPSGDSKTNMADFMAKCNKTAYFLANNCTNKLNYFNAGKFNKRNNERAETSSWGLKALLSGSYDKTLRIFDETLNKNGEKESMWKPFTVNNISGFKAINKYESNTCYNKNNETGRIVIYTFTHPNDPKSILVFTCEDYTFENSNFLISADEFMEKFILNLKFANNQ